jgi:hypothetical protein
MREPRSSGVWAAPPDFGGVFQCIEGGPSGGPRAGPEAEARAIAADGGLLYVEDRCLFVEQRRLGLDAPAA